MNDKAIEQEIQAKGLTAPRITPADIEVNIAGEYFFTAEQASVMKQYLDILLDRIARFFETATTKGE